MSTKNRKHSLQKAKIQQISNRKRQNDYNLRYTVIDKKKNYDAMEDPHASYYFFSQSVKNHLKNIKTATLNQITNPMEKKRMKKLFREKIKQKLKYPSINFSEFNDKGSHINIGSFRKTSLQSVHSQRYKSPQRQSQRQTKISINSIDHYQSFSKRHFNNTSINKERELHQITFQRFLPYEYQEEVNDKVLIQKQVQITKNLLTKNSKQDNTIKNQKQGQFRKNKQEQLHVKRHRTFLKFIEQKKKLIQDFQRSLNTKNE